MCNRYFSWVETHSISTIFLFFSFYPLLLSAKILFVPWISHLTPGQLQGRERNSTIKYTYFRMAWQSIPSSHRAVRHHEAFLDPSILAPVPTPCIDSAGLAGWEVK